MKKIVEFTRNRSPYVAGEQAAFDATVAVGLEKSGAGRIVGAVDEKGKTLFDAPDTDEATNADSGEASAAPQTAATGGGRKARS